MSSLKGQLANVEGSVKSMKMAVVVGSVLTVACLAAVFGVTILANEVSKETKVSNGALVNRNGQTVSTASMYEASMRDALLAKKLNVGDVAKVAISGGEIECAIEKMYYKNGDAAAYCSDVVFIADASKPQLGLFVAQGSLFNQVESVVPVEELQAGRKLQNPGLCFAIKMVNSMITHGMTIASVAAGDMSVGEAIYQTLAGMAWGQILGLGCLGDAYSLLKHMAGML